MITMSVKLKINQPNKEISQVFALKPKLIYIRVTAHILPSAVAIADTKITHSADVRQ